MKQIEITAKMAKTNIDAKKASVTFELEYESWNQIPNIAKMTGGTVNVVIYPTQSELELS